MLEYTDYVGRDFEFLITHPEGFTLDAETFDKIMTPSDMNWTKVREDGWDYYYVGEHFYSFSWELSGLQMTFSEQFPYKLAQHIVDRIISQLNQHFDKRFGSRFIPYMKPGGDEMLIYNPSIS